jgi:hypothetical protein
MAKLELKISRVKGGELHGIMAKQEEGLSWIGRSCGDLPTVSREIDGEDSSGDGRFEVWCKMRVQERAKWKEEKLLSVLY